MSEKFSPQAVKVMRELVKSSKPMDLVGFDKAKINSLLKIDSANEVLIRHADGKIVITRKAIQKIFEMIAGFEVGEDKIERPNLRLVYSSGAEKPKQSNEENGKSENLPQGDKAE
jgi:hypothetical protein